MSILAFVDNTNTVTLVLNTEPSLVSSFTSSAKIVEITELAAEVKVGWIYDGTKFSEPVVVEPAIPETQPVPTETTFTPPSN